MSSGWMGLSDTESASLEGPLVERDDGPEGLKQQGCSAQQLPVCDEGVGVRLSLQHKHLYSAGVQHCSSSAHYF